MLDVGLKGFDSVQARLLSNVRKNSLHHALLFSGPDGVGKKRLACALAKALMCENPPPPCGRCVVCRRADIQTHEAFLAVIPKGLVLKWRMSGPSPSFSLSARKAKRRWRL